jgi:hypothetical protein
MNDKETMHLKWWSKVSLTNMWKYQRPTGKPSGTNRVNTKMQMLLFFRFTQGKMKEHAPGTRCAQNAQTDIKLHNWMMSAMVLLDG